VSTTTGLASSVNPSVYGQLVTFTATVTVDSPGTGTPTGTVTFKDGSSILATTTLDASAIATFSFSVLGVANHSITAVYNGDTNFSGSTSAALAQTVNQASTTTTVALSVNPSVYGQAVTFTTTVTADSPGAGTPTGTVTFKDGTIVLATGTLNASAVATFSTSALGVGNHSITAVYNGDLNFSGSTAAALAEVVNHASTTTRLTSSRNPSVYGQAVTFTTTVTAVSPGTGTPSGTVTFKDGTTVLATATLDASGRATFSTSALGVGNHSITAVYGGNTSYKASTSAALTQRVKRGNTMTTLAPSAANHSVYPQAVTLTATVSPVSPGARTPTGTASSKDGATITERQHARRQRHSGLHNPIAARGQLLNHLGLLKGTPIYKASTWTKLTQTVNE
jgi:hypothetical protein